MTKILICLRYRSRKKFFNLYFRNSVSNKIQFLSASHTEINDVRRRFPHAVNHFDNNDRIILQIGHFQDGSVFQRFVGAVHAVFVISCAGSCSSALKFIRVIACITCLCKRVLKLKTHQKTDCNYSKNPIFQTV